MQLLSRFCSGNYRRRWYVWLALLVLLCLLSGCGNTGILSSGGNWQASGLRGQHIQALAADPGHLTHIYAGDADGSVFASTDTGTTWHRSDSGLPISTSISALSFDTTGQKLYAATSKGLFVSSDQAHTWQAVAGIPDAAYTALAFDINTPKDIYVSTAQAGVWKSLDGGVTWISIDRGLPANQVITSLLYDPNLKQLWMSLGTSLYRSDNGGVSWRVMSNGIPTGTSVYALALGAVTSGDGSLLFAGTDHGFFRSTDAGEHWVPSQFSLARLHITAVLLDAETPADVYTSTNIGVLRSLDSGQTWDQLATGLPSSQLNGGLVQGGANYGQIFVASGGIYIYPGSGSAFDSSRWLPLLLIVLFFVLLYLFFVVRKRPSRQTKASAS